MKKKVTSIDVAREAGVSQSLVSLALSRNPSKKVNPKTREHIIDTAKRLGYRTNMSASNMKSNRANAIGIISMWDINSFIYAPLVEGVKNECFNMNYSLTVCSSEKSADGKYDFMEYYFQQRIDGVVLISYVGLERNGILDVLDREKIPYVCIIGCREYDDITGIDADYIHGGRIASEHLAMHECKRIYYIMKNSEENLHYAEAERLMGCRAGARESSVDFREYYGFAGCRNKADYEKAAEEFIDYIKNSTDKLAVVSTSFECYSILKAAQKKGVAVPCKLSVISLDNERYNAYLTPPLTSVRQPLSEMGKAAARMLIKHMNEEHTAEKISFAPILVKREST